MGSETGTSGPGAALREPRELNPAAAGIRRLECHAMRAWNLGCITLISAGFAIYRWHAHGRFEFWVTAIPTLLILATIAMAAVAVASLPVLFTPGVRLALAPGTVFPGEEFSLEWTAQGRTGRLTRLRILLECREETGGGNDHVHLQTVPRVLSSIVLVDTARRDEIAAGRISAAVPPDALPSLNTGPRQIVWVIRVEGEVVGRPGIRDEYPFPVFPARKEAHP